MFDLCFWICFSNIRWLSTFLKNRENCITLWISRMHKQLWSYAVCRYLSKICLIRYLLHASSVEKTLLGSFFSLSVWWLLSIPVYSFCLDYGLTFCSWCQMVTFKSLSLLLLGSDGSVYSANLSSWNICWGNKTISCLSGYLSDKRLWLWGFVDMCDKCFISQFTVEFF